MTLKMKMTFPKPEFWRYFFTCFLAIYVDQYWPIVHAIYFHEYSRDLLRFILGNNKLSILIFNLVPVIISYIIVNLAFQLLKKKNNFTFKSFLICGVCVYIESKSKTWTGFQYFFANLFPLPEGTREAVLQFSEKYSWKLLYLMLGSITFLSALPPIVFSFFPVTYIYNQLIKIRTVKYFCFRS